MQNLYPDQNNQYLVLIFSLESTTSNTEMTKEAPQLPTIDSGNRLTVNQLPTIDSGGGLTVNQLPTIDSGGGLTVNQLPAIDSGNRLTVNHLCLNVTGNRLSVNRPCLIVTIMYLMAIITASTVFYLVGINKPKGKFYIL